METVRSSDLLIIQEEQTPPELQRLWARRSITTQLLDDDIFDDNFFPAQECDDGPLKSRNSSPAPPELWEVSDESDCEKHSPEEDALPLMCLDASVLGDIPARYVIPSLPNHEFPVIGVFVDPRVVPGFKYRVRVLPDPERPHKTSYLFDGQALTLESLGRGYSRRLTFASNGDLNNNENYFWSDSRNEGFGFEVQLVSVGDKFMIHDLSQLVAGTIETVIIQGPQEEVSHTVLKDGSVEKRAKIKAMCRVEWFDDSGAIVLLPMSGIAVSVKKKGGTVAELVRIVTVTIGSCYQKRGFTLTPGVQSNWRRTTVNGSTIGDVPIKYTITGLESFELPVVGTYVDPRIVPGYRYTVRPAGHNKKLFSGQTLRLVSIGMGYAKRLTFESSPTSLNQSENHFWSDSHLEGYGFEPVAVAVGMKFTIQAHGQVYGHAQIFRADRPQQEVAQSTEATDAGYQVTKYIDIDITCHVKFASQDGQEKVMRVTGTAVLIKRARTNEAKLVRIENIGLDSQINLLFVHQHQELIFLPN